MTTLIDYTPTLYQVFADHDGAMNWLRDHGVEPETVPMSSPFELDTAFNEWRIEQYVRGDPGGFKVDEFGEPVRRVVRRAFKSLPPWATEKMRRETADAMRDDIIVDSAVAVEPWPTKENPAHEGTG